MSSTKVSCSLSQNKIQCWGDPDEMVIAKLPNFSNPKALSIRNGTGCAIDEGRVKCWGYYNHKNIKKPKLLNPTAISVEAMAACVIDQGELKCWQFDEAFKKRRKIEFMTAPKIKNVKQITSGDWHSCALADQQVTCWGDSSEGKTNVPKLVNPTSIAADRMNTCAIHQEGVVCWGPDAKKNKYGETLFNVPKLKSPTHLSVGGGKACVIDDSELKCWGQNVKKIFQTNSQNSKISESSKCCSGTIPYLCF